MSVFGRIVERLGQDQAELEAGELAKECTRAGCTRIGTLRERQVVEVTGCVHSLAAQPRDRAPELQVDLYDGTGLLRLVWLGRREIEGIRPGVFLTVRGRVTVVQDQKTMFNPGYQLLPDHG